MSRTSRPWLLNFSKPELIKMFILGMKPFRRMILIHRRATLLAWLATASLIHAATIWNGPLITYTQPSPDPTLAANQDRLTPNVWLTRESTAGLFNAVTESVYTKPESPDDTEWAVGNLADATTLTYSTWEGAGGGRPVQNLPGQQLVLHLITDDIYLSIKFTNLGGHGAGGFSYIRSTPGDAANNPPAVTVTNPASGAVFASPANVTIQATATDSDGTVTNVQFLVGATFLANITTAPFSATASNLAAGSYTLSAIATDNNGATATNAMTISVVTPVPVIFSGVQPSAGANFQFNYSANVGLRYIVQRSASLAPANWITLTTNTAGGNPVVFVDNHATNNTGFYRVGRLPNP
jgi:hypothetical protein